MLSEVSETWQRFASRADSIIHEGSSIHPVAVQVANRCCDGRVVSALEGGYRIQGKIISAFSRSVAAHVRALCEPSFQVRAGRPYFNAPPAAQCPTLAHLVSHATRYLPREAPGDALVGGEDTQQRDFWRGMQVWEPEEGRAEQDHERELKMARKKAALEVFMSPPERTPLPSQRSPCAALLHLVHF